ncbi:MAG TPA: aldo/keto reductase, partial [Armatimonadetes bacterium]|nr:aldo/keto reductase [Armatimonadota bacterium]
MKDERMNRRDFLKTLAQCYLAAHTVTTAPGRPSAAVEPGLPKRTLGRTKEKVTILGLGTAPVGEGPIGLQEGLRIFQEAIELGVNYIDTARIYGNAEEILGHLVPQQRDRLFIATKVWADTREQAERSLTQSLRLMKLDYVDLVHIHSAGNRNLDKVLAPKGVLDYLLEQKERG